MTKKDAQASYKDFKKEAGGEKIKLDKFTKLVNSMNTNKGKKWFYLWQKRIKALLVDFSSPEFYFTKFGNFLHKSSGITCCNAEKL